MDTEAVMAVLRRVLDPEHPINVVEMGLVKPEDVTITDDEITIEFAPTTPYCPMGAVIGIVIRKAMEDAMSGRRIVVRVKSGTHMQEDACNQMINDETYYQEALQRLEDSGYLDRLILKE